MLSLCLIVENSTDIRLVEGLSELFDLTLLGRSLEGKVKISQPPTKQLKIVVGPPSRTKFSLFVWQYLRQHQHQFDFVLVQGYGLPAIAANLASYLTQTHTAMLVCSPTEAYYQCRKFYSLPEKPFRRYELFALQILARLNALIGRQYLVLSNYLGDVIRSHGAKQPIEIVPLYGVDTDLFTPTAVSKEVIKTKLGLPTTGSLIFFSSRIAPEKDSETLLLAFKDLLERGYDLWLLHRSGGYQSFLQEAKQYGIAERVIATDAVHPHRELPFDYQACDLCVQSSREEGLGFSPLEALACEVPVIASAVGGLQETIIDGETGWTYPVGDVQTLANCLEKAIADPVEAMRRAKRGRELVVSKYERQIVFQKLIQVIELPKK
jgi:glycosyltransferase involved in cell wall biosynthesis